MHISAGSVSGPYYRGIIPDSWQEELEQITHQCNPCSALEDTDNLPSELPPPPDAGDSPAAAGHLPPIDGTAFSVLSSLWDPRLPPAVLTWKVG